ncbi:glycosyltransferase family 4 protein [Flavobacterium sp. TAB 87]|uniref:MraY family glycosyltransferase n=1 Tax=Flavobacterium sp. TAB 87 TaxID=1729581 RepID=UPI00076D1152|nr:glycosyltransferase family 4 protein [Flavobacterium sp. TAB 87]KVV13979.1 putative undecaprenyl-phosphate N-acetylglucosaminyl 1-phosphate transferase [Flavobacterium sp. TAB 87]
MQYFFLFFLFLGIELLYFRLADHYNIIDKPNSRSSHTSITLRGGGIIFPIAMIVACFMGYCSWYFTLAVVLVGAVSFIDDIKPISQLPRFAFHCIAILLVIYDLDLFREPIWLLMLLFILVIGWVNAFNFMDGINGITVLYALVAIGSFAYLPVNFVHFSLLSSMFIAAAVFGIFNFRKKAKTFAGDVGSIGMAVFLGYFMIFTILETGQIGYLLFFAVYGIDAIITIASRLAKRENIFEAHRSHLYQYLANELGFSHLKVAFLYAFVQIIINLLLIFLDKNDMLTFLVSLGILVVLSFAYLFMRRAVVKKIAI